MPGRQGGVRVYRPVGVMILWTLMWVVIPSRPHPNRTSDACASGRVAYASPMVSTGNAVMWSRTYGTRVSWEEAYRALSLSDGTYIVFGRKDAVNMYSAAWLLRLNEMGGILWQETFSSVEPYGMPMLRADGSGFLVGPLRSGRIARFQVSGQVDWSFGILGGGCCTCYIDLVSVGMLSIPDGWLYVATDKTWEYRPYGYLFHVDPGLSIRGGWHEPEYSEYRVVVSDSLGGMLIGGVRFIFSQDDPDADPRVNGLLVRVDTAGQPLTRAALDIPGTGFEILDVAALADGDRLILGIKQNSGRNVVIARMTPSGKFLWQKTIFGISLNVRANMAVTSNDEILIAGRDPSSRDIVSVLLSSKGQILWARRYTHPGEEYAYGVATTQDGGFMILGSTIDRDTEELLVLKTDHMGRIGACSRPFQVEYSDTFDLVYSELPDDFYHLTESDLYIFFKQTGFTPPQRSGSRSRPFCVVLQPRIAVQPEAVDFGIVRTGLRAERVVTVRNTGTVTVELRERTTPGTPFTVVEDTCAPYPSVLRPRTSCTVTVRFAPRREGVYRDHFTWTVRAGDVDTYASVSLRGVAVPVLRIRP